MLRQRRVIMHSEWLLFKFKVSVRKNGQKGVGFFGSDLPLRKSIPNVLFLLSIEECLPPIMQIQTDKNMKHDLNWGYKRYSESSGYFSGALSQRILSCVSLLASRFVCRRAGLRTQPVLHKKKGVCSKG